MHSNISCELQTFNFTDNFQIDNNNSTVRQRDWNISWLECEKQKTRNKYFVSNISTIVCFFTATKKDEDV